MPWAPAHGEEQQQQTGLQGSSIWCVVARSLARRAGAPSALSAPAKAAAEALLARSEADPKSLHGWKVEMPNGFWEGEDDGEHWMGSIYRVGRVRGELCCDVRVGTQNNVIAESNTATARA